MAFFDIDLYDHGTFPDINLSPPSSDAWSNYINGVDGLDANKYNGISYTSVASISGVE